MPIHSFLIRQPNLDIILRDDIYGVTYLFTVAQLRSYSRFDRTLRRGEFLAATMPIPGGYEIFQQVWSRDVNCPFQFASYNPLDGHVEVAGQQIDIDVLAPELTPRTPVAPPALPNDQQEVVQDLLWSLARRDKRSREFAEKRKRERLLKSEEKRETKRRRVLGGPENLSGVPDFFAPSEVGSDYGFVGGGLDPGLCANEEAVVSAPANTTGKGAEGEGEGGPVAGPSGTTHDDAPEGKETEKGGEDDEFMD
ncbi:hypothetical protein B0H21DRAFT_701747 [Amylocystis lapponica]|nr:hypothetical protein B0H21DRAFT_701747 [Amylocystis lapponica]